jgi:glycosyltransferase involved in cell wall biosynthesis
MKCDLPKITVITVCYNASHLLKKTIESAAEQSYSEIEYIIVDGASKDDTKEIVGSYGKKVQLFLSEPDNGIYDAMNKGIKQATGDLIIFLNAGDYFVSKDVLKFYLSKMKILEADLFFGRIVWNDSRTNDICLSDHHNTVHTWDLKNSNFPHPATIYKKDLFKTVGLFDLDFPIAADYEWNVRAMVLNKIKFQYINIIVTVFYADGISNNPSFATQHRIEIDQVNRRYFKPWKLHEKMEHKGHSFIYKMIEKVSSKYYKCRLSRVY